MITKQQGVSETMTQGKKTLIFLDEIELKIKDSVMKLGSREEVNE